MTQPNKNINHQRRINILQSKLQIAGYDHFLLTNPVSIDYLIGQRFQPMERFLAILIPQQGKPLLLLNRLFPCDATDFYDIVDINDGDDIIALVLKYCTKALAIDDSLPAKWTLPLFKQLPDVQLGSFLIDEMRLIKDQAEQNTMRQASVLNDQVMKEVQAALRPGVIDHDIEDLIHQIHKRMGLSASFAPIVAFGDVASDPHGYANGQVLAENDSVIIDMGLVYEDYCSDMTRTFVFGQTEMKPIYDIVRKANLAAIQAVKPGARFCDVDRAARSVIEEAGYGPFFTHRTGHGIGLDVHEPMDVSGVNTAILKPGMCFSIEPGIYLPGKGGIRIEDLVIVTDQGVEVLNQYQK